MIIIQPCNDPYVLAALNEEVQELHASLFPDRFKSFNYDEFAHYFETFVAHEGFNGIVAYDDDIPIGYAITITRINPETAFKFASKVLYIDQFGVNKSHRKCGVGRMLMDEISKIALYNNISRIELDHWTANTNAEQFFSRMGFNLFYEKMCREV